jgi:hypothetical protein
MVSQRSAPQTSEAKELRSRFAAEVARLPKQPMGRFIFSAPGTMVVESPLVDAALDSRAGGRPNFRTTQWGRVAAASAKGVPEARAALEELYRLYCYPV